MTAPTPTPDHLFGFTAEEFTQAVTRAAPYMPAIPVPSRWSAFKNWLRA